MNEELRIRLAKIYELIKRGSTEGERNAAQKALDRLISKYNLDGIDLDSLDKSKYTFKYSTNLELRLISRLCKCLIDDKSAINTAYRQTYSVRQVVINLTYLDFITLSASYEYFRRHMKSQWNKICLPVLNKCRKKNTKKKKKEQLEHTFFEQYAIKSKLFLVSELVLIELDQLNNIEKEKLYMMKEIEGGKYNKQVVSSLLLN